MTGKRLWWTFRMYTIRSMAKRAVYAKKHHIYAGIGENVFITSRVVPLYSELIKFHSNIVVARNVDFCTHDVIHRVFNHLPAKTEAADFRFSEQIGCVEVMDNVFIGSNSVILFNTKIGPNVIIASGSVVTKDCEPNSVYAGVPAKKIGSYDEYMAKRQAAEQNGVISITKHNQHLTEEEIQRAWSLFDANKNDLNN